MEERAFQQMVLEQLDTQGEKNEYLNLSLTLFTKVNSKWITDINVPYKTIWHLEKTQEKIFGRVPGLDIHNTVHKRKNW